MGLSYRPMATSNTKDMIEDIVREILNRVDWLSATRDMDVEEKVNFLNGKMEEAVSSTFQDLLERKK